MCANLNRHLPQHLCKATKIIELGSDDRCPYPYASEVGTRSSHVYLCLFSSCRQWPYKYSKNLKPEFSFLLSLYQSTSRTMTNYGLPYILEDKTGLLVGSDFIDIHDRMKLSLRCTSRDPQRMAFSIYNITPSLIGGALKPGAVLDFGPNHALGTVTIGNGVNMPMKEYLPKVSSVGSSKNRKFEAADGQEYTWSWRTADEYEWVCMNSQGYPIAYYSLKLDGEPQYSGSSGCALTIDEAYPHLAVEILASLTIMRHIAAYEL